MNTFPDVEQSLLCLRISALIPQTSTPFSLLSVMFSTILCFLFVISLFKLPAPNQSVVLKFSLVFLKAQEGCDAPYGENACVG